MKTAKSTVHTGELLGNSTAAERAISPDSPDRRSSALDMGILAAITVAGAFLRFHTLAAKTFWFDEGMSVGIARLDWFNFARILWRREANMSLYYLLLRPWLHFGNSEYFVRSLSVIFGLATIPALYFLSRKLFGSRVGLIATALLAVNAYHIRYSQEARSYSLMVLLCVCSGFYFLKYLEDPSRRNRMAHIALSSAAVYAHFYSALFIVAQWISTRYWRSKPLPTGLKSNWRWIALFISPIILFIATTGAGPLRWIHRPGLKDLTELALRLTGNGGWIFLAAYGIACVAGLFPQSSERDSLRSWRACFLLLWLLFPIVFVFLLSFARPLFLPRYFILCLPPLLLLTASGLARIRSPWLMAPALLLFLALSVQGTRGYYQHDFDLDRDNWRGASEYLLSQSLTGDALMFHVAMGRMPYEYYHSLRGASLGDPLVIYPDHGKRITFLDFVEKPDYQKLISVIPAYPRVWLVLSHASDPSGLDVTASSLTKLLENAGYVASDTRDFDGLNVKLYIHQK
ncbi:MAG TPA: glycosyltransferase family 39 protein [Candidatus Acidoferrum sp.]